MMTIFRVARDACGLFALTALLAGCGTDSGDEGAVAFPGRYQALPGEPTLLSGATILTGTGERLDNADILLRDGRIEAVGRGLDPAGARVVDADGMWVTPGIIDVHSHLGVYPSPSTESHSDGNEATSPVTAEVWAEHSVWPQDPGFVAALAGGVTALQVLPGSANLIGGRSVTLKNVPGRDVQSNRFSGTRERPAPSPFPTRARTTKPNGAVWGSRANRLIIPTCIAGLIMTIRRSPQRSPQRSASGPPVRTVSNSAAA